MDKYTENTTFTKTLLGYGVWITLLITTFVLTIIIACATPSLAYAKTIAEYDQEIAEQEKIVEKADKENTTAQKTLGEAAVWYYQNGAPSNLLDIIVFSTNFVETINKAEYVSIIYQQYAEAVKKAKDAKQNAETQQTVLEELKKEKTNRALSLKNAGKIQFAQSGMDEWSNLRYWTGTISRSGCGLCAYTVIINVLTGNEYTPADMYKIRGDWKGMDGYPDDFTGSKGKTHAEWTKDKFDIDTYNISISVNDLKKEVSKPEACAMVCSAGNSFKNKSGEWRYSGGHFVAVLGYDEEGFHVSDSAYTWDEGHDVVYSDNEMARMLRSANHITVYQN